MHFRGQGQSINSENMYMYGKMGTSIFKITLFVFIHQCSTWVLCCTLQGCFGQNFRKHSRSFKTLKFDVAWSPEHFDTLVCINTFSINSKIHVTHQGKTCKSQNKCSQTPVICKVQMKQNYYCWATSLPQLQAVIWYVTCVTISAVVNTTFVDIYVDTVNIPTCRYNIQHINKRTMEK